MAGSAPKSRGPDSRGGKGSAWRDSRLAYPGLVLLVPALYVAGTYFRHRGGGTGWLEALGLPLDSEFLGILGGLVVLVVLTVFMLQNIRRLPPSREKTLLVRIGNLLLGFLFVWPFVYVMWLS